MRSNCRPMQAEDRRQKEVRIRAYEAGDRSRVREICYVTGYMGDRVDWLWRDFESFADLFTSYYTDAEPESAFVAEVGGIACGYLLGCVDSRKAWDPAAIFRRHFLRRAIAFRPGTAGVVWRSFRDVAVDSLRGRLPAISFHDDRWPAHLHIDLLPSIRGRGAGGALMRAWFEHLEELGVAGCHLETLGENRKAIAFFEATGFHRRGALRPAPGLRSPHGERHSVQLMVRPAP